MSATNIPKGHAAAGAIPLGVSDKLDSELLETGVSEELLAGFAALSANLLYIYNVLSTETGCYLVTLGSKNYTIRTEQPCDFKAIENLTREAFWNVYRPGCTEHYVLHCYRENPDFIPELSLVLEVDGEIVGHVMYAWSHIDADDGRKIKMMTFGPISIRPDFKRKGYGKILLDHSMELAKKMGAGCLLIVGNIDFYGKSGFMPALTKGIRYDDPEATYFLCKELDDGFLDGITGSYHDPEGYFVADQNPEAFERFDAEFSPKEKLKLPGQLF